MKDGVIAGVLLAAGESSRMGTPKALLPWAGTTLIEYQLGQMLLAGVSPISVVLGHDARRIGEAMVALPEGVQIVVNRAFREGRSGSIRVGVSSLEARATDILIHAVDQPRTAGTLRSIVEAHLRGQHLITVPVHEGRRGHPPVMSSSLLPELLSLSEDREGLRELMHRHAAGIAEVLLMDQEILLDLNTPADYRQALHRLQRHETTRQNW